MTNLSGGEEYTLRDVTNATCYGPQGHAREDVGIVALAGVHHLAVDLLSRKRTATGKHAAALEETIMSLTH